MKILNVPDCNKEADSEKIKKETNEKAYNLKWYLKYDGIQFLTLIQLVLCTLIFLVFLIFKSIGGNLYNSIKSWYIYNINDSLIAGSDIRVHKGLSKKLVLKNKIDNVNLEEDKELFLSSVLTPPLDNGVITSRFGERKDPIDGENRVHCGMDIGGEKNKPIFSVLPGIVEKCDKNLQYGNYIIIDHGNNIKTVYAHCSKIKKQENQKVKRGEKIAFLGSTGRSTGNHLHFEIIVNDKKYDPEPLLKGIYI